MSKPIDEQIAGLICSAVPRIIAGRDVTAASFAVHFRDSGSWFTTATVHAAAACHQGGTFADATIGLAGRLGDPVASAAELRRRAADLIADAEELEKKGGVL